MLHSRLANYFYITCSAYSCNHCALNDSLITRMITSYHIDVVDSNECLIFYSVHSYNCNTSPGYIYKSSV